MTTAGPDLRSIGSALTEVRAELTRADQKASILLALFSAMTAGIAAVFVVRDSGIFALRNGVEWIAWGGISCLAASFAHLLYCVRPQNVSHHQSERYFVFYARFSSDPAALVTHMSQTVADGGLESCTQLIELSVLATRKYRLIARAVDLLGCAITLIVGATLLDAFR